MTPEITLSVITFLGVTSLGLLLLMLIGSRRSRLDVRLAELSGKAEEPMEQDPFAQFTRQTLPKMGVPLIPKDEDERTKLQTRLIHAGYYSRQALYVFFGIKMILILGPMFLGLLIGVAGIAPLAQSMIGGAIVGVFGMIGPSFFLDRQKSKRQTNLRRALPDAMDILVICLEGGLSFAAAMRRVGTELQAAHPLLSKELNICQREIQLGWSSGEALRRLANRCDLEEIRSLASVVTQSERYGASLVKALRVHAETLRTTRMQRAEEMAQKAAIKILFPTLLFIFPGIFIVILGPAAIQIYETFANLQK